MQQSSSVCCVQKCGWGARDSKSRPGAVIAHKSSHRPAIFTRECAWTYSRPRPATCPAAQNRVGHYPSTTQQHWCSRVRKQHPPASRSGARPTNNVRVPTVAAMGGVFTLTERNTGQCSVVLRK
eukprot:INCI14397.3.p1 GENE.INCI14397.3~~INCI14397.3.p1  ORF type:complete len:124 (-),score=8.80 INCI14397.3:134-505(-)